MEPGWQPLLQTAGALTTRARRRSALLLHCAKMRGRRLRRNFIPSAGALLKYDAGC